ncbi:MAG TPA: cytochrome c biogenesis protein CcsA, partial [Candidatus Saccharimonadales bacterium]|nr:cytochrome c biogenesis protein CcsA [Candidatus Saccharimonadales bacterium]
MIGLAGLTASVIGFGAAVLGCVYAIRAARGGPLAPAVALVRVAFGALLAAGLAMEAALVTHDFSVAYVAQVGSRETPLLYTVASLWGALAGSVLFWAILLAGVTALLTWRTSPADRPFLPVSLAVLAGLVAFFAFIVVGPGSPWGRVDPVPADGPGPNPLLQSHPLVAIHPPLLYLGFVGLAVPFALTVAALWAGRLDAAWLRTVRRWTLGPWIALSLALVAGAWWSYAVLGWGGYWAW